MRPGRGGPICARLRALVSHTGRPPCSRESGPFGSSTERKTSTSPCRRTATNPGQSQRAGTFEPHRVGRSGRWAQQAEDPSSPLCLRGHRDRAPTASIVVYARETNAEPLFHVKHRPRPGEEPVSAPRVSAFVVAAWVKDPRERRCSIWGGNALGCGHVALTLTHARASDGCDRRPPGPGVPASPEQRTIPLAAKGFCGNGCGDRIRADQPGHADVPRA